MRSLRLIVAPQANHPHLATQRSLYAAISRARDWAELVTDDKAALQEQLEAVTGERIAALEAVEPESAKGREAGVDAGRSAGRENAGPVSGGIGGYRGVSGGIGGGGPRIGAGDGTVPRVEGAGSRFGTLVPLGGSLMGTLAIGR